MRRIVSRLALLSVVAALLLLAQPASSQSDITITDLGPVCPYCGPVDLNSQGHVVGWDAPSSAGSIQFLWTPESGRKDLTDLGWLYYVHINDRGQVVATSYIYPQGLQPILVEGDEVTALGDLEGGFAIPHDINELGHVVGESSTAAHDLHAFLWTPDRQMEDLGTLPGGNYARALAANDLDWVVGEGVTAVGEGDAVGFEIHAFLWTPQTGMRDLGTLGGTSSIAGGINNLGQVVGGSFTGTGEFHAFLWTAEGGMRDLGTLGGMVSAGSDINELGHVVGWSHTPSGEAHAFLWTPEGGMQDLGALDGIIDDTSRISVNNSDQVVGTWWLTTDQSLAFVWTPTEGMWNLGALPGHQHTVAAGINDNGQVAGTSSAATSERHAVLWTVNLSLTPEEKIAALINEISQLVDNGVLNKGQGNALVQKLQNALRMLVQEKTPATCGQLQAFINQVEAYTKTGVLPEDIGLGLIFTANSVIGEVCG